MKFCDIGRNLRVVFAIGIFCFSCSVRQLKPISQHPENPHYFLFRGKPVILIGSTEHYGAVMNLDFDYNVYLEEIAENGLNITRHFMMI